MAGDLIMMDDGRTILPITEEDILRTLSEFSPMSMRWYAELKGIAASTAFERLKSAHQMELIHIANYVRGRAGPPAPHFAIGAAPDEERPPKKTSTERSTTYRAKVRADPAKFRAAKKKVNLRRREHRADNTSVAMRERAYGAEWKRKRYGHKQRKPALQDKDPLLAILMGVRVAPADHFAQSLQKAETVDV